MKIDTIDRVLYCVRLGWHRTEGVPGRFSASREFGFVPLESVKGVVHVARKDSYVFHVEKKSRRRIVAEMRSEEQSGQECKHFYVNKFMRYSSNIFHDKIIDRNSKIRVQL